ncbi:MAG: hypothetical protein IBX71_08815, partial [Candidatus Desulforudis sp.]|nr:hypothetical protein [Desulforudis sp.]
MPTVVGTLEPLSLLRLLAWLAVLAGAAGVYHWVFYRTHRRLLRQRLERLLHYRAGPRPGPLAELGERFDASGTGRRLAEGLARTNLGLRPSQYALVYLAVVALASWLGRIFFRIDFPLNV